MAAIWDDVDFEAAEFLFKRFISSRVASPKDRLVWKQLIILAQCLEEDLGPQHEMTAHVWMIVLSELCVTPRFSQNYHNRATQFVFFFNGRLVKKTIRRQMSCPELRIT